jgi:hypothetical protein
MLLTIFVRKPQQPEKASAKALSVLPFVCSYGASGLSKLSREPGKIHIKVALEEWLDLNIVHSELAGQKRFLKSTAFHPSALTSLSERVAFVKGRMKTRKSENKKENRGKEEDEEPF